MKMKIGLAIFLVAALVLTLASCGSDSGPADSGSGASAGAQGDSANADTGKASAAHYTEDGRRIITIGTWQDIYYVSKHTDIKDDPSVSDPDGTEETQRRIEQAEMRLAKIREIEEKYKVVLDYVNLTFNGVQESIGTSVPEGIPDVDIYQIDTQFGIPAVLNGYGTALEDFLPEDAEVFAEDTAAKRLKLAGQDKTYLFNAARGGGVSSYPLAFNMDLIRAAGLENPQDLYDRGEWTWDAWKIYLKALTKDTNGDEEIDIYGYSGYWTNMLSNLLMSNNAGIATGETQTLDAPATRETLDFIYELYNVEKTARPWYAPNWEINNKLYSEGLSGFWICADWIFDEQGGADLPFEIGVVPWPYGPSGDPETNSYSTPDSTWFMIPKGADDPELIFDVMYDWMDWYEGDESIVTSDWSRELYMTDRNFEYAAMMSERQGFDLWDSLNKPINFSLVDLLDGAQTTDELIEKFALPFQDSLDEYFGKK